jgi:hypothetical protein
MKLLTLLSAALLLSASTLMANRYRFYFFSKGTGPISVEIEAQNDKGARDQVKARYPGAYSITVIQII